jgi:hypothetical protein
LCVKFVLFERLLVCPQTALFERFLVCKNCVISKPVGV